MNRLDGLEWRGRWASHLGCLKGCLDHLGMQVSDAWLCGATGHAFVLNVHGELCPSGPTAWRAEPIHRLGRNLGYAPELTLGFKHEADFREKQDLAWGRIRTAIDEGLPWFGWELSIPEYYLIYGYDHVGYLYRGPDCHEGASPRAWSTVGDSGIGVLEMYAIRPAQPAADATAAAAALRFAVDYALDPSPWTFEGNPTTDDGRRTTVGGYGRNGRRTTDDAVWSECRTAAAESLGELLEKLELADLEPLRSAKARYAAVADCLTGVAMVFPFIHQLGGMGEEEMQAIIRDLARCRRAGALLRSARQEEGQGLRSLEPILQFPEQGDG